MDWQRLPEEERHDRCAAIGSALAAALVHAAQARLRRPASVDSGNSFGASGRHRRRSNRFGDPGCRRRVRHGRDCDVRIGRYCYWRGDDRMTTMARARGAGDSRAAERAHSAARQRRRRPARRRLDRRPAHSLPRRGGTDRRRDQAAAECRAEAWWCSALAGYAAHGAGRFDVADSLFDVALGRDERGRALPLDRHLRPPRRRPGRPLKNLDCTERETLARRIFWLGSPLLSVSPSDLLTEHFARLTQARIAERSASPDGDGVGRTTYARS